MKYHILLLSFLVTVVACSNLDSEKLVGKWQAYYISEGGAVLDIDYAPIKFEFTEDGFYSFNSTIDYKEAGTYYINQSLLFTLDTVNTASTEKAVQITSLTTDTLVLNMVANGQEKIMKLKRADE